MPGASCVSEPVKWWTASSRPGTRGRRLSSGRCWPGGGAAGTGPSPGGSGSSSSTPRRRPSRPDGRCTRSSSPSRSCARWAPERRWPVSGIRSTRPASPACSPRRRDSSREWGWETGGCSGTDGRSRCRCSGFSWSTNPATTSPPAGTTSTHRRHFSFRFRRLSHRSGASAPSSASAVRCSIDASFSTWARRDRWRDSSWPLRSWSGAIPSRVGGAPPPGGVGGPPGAARARWGFSWCPSVSGWGYRLSEVGVAPPLGVIGHSAIAGWVEFAGQPIGLGESLLTHWVRLAVLPGTGVVHLSLPAFAGWVGAFITGLNLLPLSQLDGGHVLYGLLGRHQRVVAGATVLLLLLLAQYSLSWLVWVAMTFLIGGGRWTHPSVVVPEREVPAGRRWVGLACVAVFLITFVPIPFGR